MTTLNAQRPTLNQAAPTAYLLHLADNALILGQRNAEWCGHAPILEEDMAMANNSLDLIGQARLLYQHAAERLAGDVRAPRGASWPAGNCTGTWCYRCGSLPLPSSAPCSPCRTTAPC